MGIDLYANEVDKVWEDEAIKMLGMKNDRCDVVVWGIMKENNAGYGRSSFGAWSGMP